MPGDGNAPGARGGARRAGRSQPRGRANRTSVAGQRGGRDHEPQEGRGRAERRSHEPSGPGDRESRAAHPRRGKGPVCRRRRGRRGVLPRPRADRLAGTRALAWTRPGGCPAPRCVGERRHLGAVVSGAPWFPAARRGPSRSRLVRPGRLPARAGARARPRADRGHPGRARARRGAGDRPLAWRHVRPVARSRRFRADLRGGRDRRTRRRAPGRTRAHAAVAADRPRARRRCLALTQPASCLSHACSPRGLAPPTQRPHRTR